jgi:hypothetical protein
VAGGSGGGGSDGRAGGIEDGEEPFHLWTAWSQEVKEAIMPQ